MTQGAPDPSAFNIRRQFLRGAELLGAAQRLRAQRLAPRRQAQPGRRHPQLRPEPGIPGGRLLPRRHRTTGGDAGRGRRGPHPVSRRSGRPRPHALSDAPDPGLASKLAAHGLAHVRFLTAVVTAQGATPIPRPALDAGPAPVAAATAATGAGHGLQFLCR
ncbi:ferritin-like domain-containing protein [Deinococcus hopiensis]|uniref:ferritin-like domain-containing protein n=1 Tax=Deinococcus hopiensis TaxID=309885 RepID=UPI00111C368D|nr:ferritin-like domain-containing protein [Deinococcus hopiensis]